MAKGGKKSKKGNQESNQTTDKQQQSTTSQIKKENLGQNNQVKIEGAQVEKSQDVKVEQINQTQKSEQTLNNGQKQIIQQTVDEVPSQNINTQVVAQTLQTTQSQPTQNQHQPIKQKQQITIVQEEIKVDAIQQSQVTEVTSQEIKEIQPNSNGQFKEEKISENKSQIQVNQQQKPIVQQQQIFSTVRSTKTQQILDQITPLTGRIESQLFYSIVDQEQKDKTLKNHKNISQLQQNDKTHGFEVLVNSQTVSNPDLHSSSERNNTPLQTTNQHIKSTYQNPHDLLKQQISNQQNKTQNISNASSSPQEINIANQQQKISQKGNIQQSNSIQFVQSTQSCFDNKQIAIQNGVQVEGNKVEQSEKVVNFVVQQKKQQPERLFQLVQSQEIQLGLSTQIQAANSIDIAGSVDISNKSNEPRNIMLSQSFSDLNFVNSQSSSKQQTINLHQQNQQNVSNTIKQQIEGIQHKQVQKVEIKAYVEQEREKQQSKIEEKKVQSQLKVEQHKPQTQIIRQQPVIIEQQTKQLLQSQTTQTPHQQSNIKVQQNVVSQHHVNNTNPPSQIYQSILYVHPQSEIQVQKRSQIEVHHQYVPLPQNVTPLEKKPSIDSGENINHEERRQDIQQASRNVESIVVESPIIKEEIKILHQDNKQQKQKSVPQELEKKQPINQEQKYHEERRSNVPQQLKKVEIIVEERPSQNIIKEDIKIVHQQIQQQQPLPKEKEKEKLIDPKPTVIEKKLQKDEQYSGLTKVLFTGASILLAIGIGVALILKKKL